MKAERITWMAAVGAVALALGAGGCGRQTRGNADAHGQSRAATTDEGGSVSTTGSAGQAKNFGDTSRSGADGGRIDNKTAAENSTPASNRPENQPRKSTKAVSETPPQPGASSTSGTSLIGDKK